MRDTLSQLVTYVCCSLVLNMPILCFYLKLILRRSTIYFSNVSDSCFYLGLYICRSLVQLQPSVRCLCVCVCLCIQTVAFEINDMTLIFCKLVHFDLHRSSPKVKVTD